MDDWIGVLVAIAIIAAVVWITWFLAEHPFRDWW